MMLIIILMDKSLLEHVFPHPPPPFLLHPPPEVIAGIT